MRTWELRTRCGVLALVAGILAFGAAQAAEPPSDPVARLRATKIPFEDLKLAVKPETMTRIGATSFDGYRTHQQHILLLLFTFPSEDAVKAGRKAAIEWATEPRLALLHYGRTLAGGRHLLLLGTSTEKPLSPETAKTMDVLEKAFRQ